MRGIIFDSQPRYLAEYKLPLLWGTDVISSHHTVDNGTFHALLFCIGHNLIENFNGGGNVLVIGEFFHIGYAAEIILGAKVSAEINDALYRCPFFLNYGSCPVQNTAGPAPYGAYLHTGPPAFLLQRFPAVPKLFYRPSKIFDGIAVEFHKVEPQLLGALKASAFRLHDNAQFHENSSFSYSLFL